MEKKPRKNKPGAGAPKGNKNAEVWSKETVEALLTDMYKIVKRDNTYHFVVAVCDEVEMTHTQILQLIDRFPELKPIYEKIKNRCMRNCYETALSMKGNPSVLIRNLASNHGWSEKIDNDSTIDVKGFNIKDLLGFKSSGE